MRNTRAGNEVHDGHSCMDGGICDCGSKAPLVQAACLNALQRMMQACASGLDDGSSLCGQQAQRSMRKV